MGFDRFKIIVMKALYEGKHGPLPGDPDSPTSSIFVVNELNKLGFMCDYLAKPAGQNTCFPTVHVHTTTHRGLPVERAVQLIFDSKPRKVRHQHGVITAWYGREPCGGPGCSDSFRRFLSGRSVFRFRLPEVLAGG